MTTNVITVNLTVRWNKMSLTVINKQGNKALVKSNRSNKSFPVTMQTWLKHLVCVGDLAIIKKSPVSGELIMVDYVRFIDEVKA